MTSPRAWYGSGPPPAPRLLADAYGLSTVERRALPDLGVARADVTWLRMKASAEQFGGGWARMWAEGVGDAIRRRQSWLVANRDDLLAALV